MTRTPATPIVRIDDGRVIATEWQFAPGAETGWHVHGHDYVVVPLTDGDVLLEEPGGGTRTAVLKKHIPYARKVGVEHNVVNAGSAEMAFLEVEIVDRQQEDTRLATLSRFMDAWNNRDVDALMDCMSQNCAFHASAGPDADGRRHEGAAAVRAAYTAIFDAFPEAAWTASRHMVFGDRGVSEWRFVGRSRDDSRVEVDGCDLFAFDGPLIQLKNSFRKWRST